MIFKISLFLLLFLASTNLSISQITPNVVTSVTFENNLLVINTQERITYAEARLQEPDRLVIDILNCSLRDKSQEKTFTSDLGEKISISEPTLNQVRIVILGEASINRKSYLTNGEKTFVTRIARIGLESTEEKIEESSEQTSLGKYTSNVLKELIVKDEEDKTNIIISATKSIKYNTYLLKNPDRFAIDLLNVSPPSAPLPTFHATSFVTGVRIGRAASGVEAARVVIDLAKDNLDADVSSNLLGNKLEITFRVSSELEKEKKSRVKVAIDPGHGGYDTGASYGGFEEKYITLEISNKLKKYLEDSDIKVFLTREDDSFLSLAERVEITNSIRPDVFVSVHANALSTSRGIRGVETYWWSTQSQRLAYLLHKSVLNHLNIPDHFIRKAKFYVIRHTSSPAVLAELGFLTNHYDRQLLTNSTTQDKYAKAVSEAILRFLDVEMKQEAGSRKHQEQKQQ